MPAFAVVSQFGFAGSEGSWDCESGAGRLPGCQDRSSDRAQMTAAGKHLDRTTDRRADTRRSRGRSGESAEAERIIPNRAPARIPAESETKAQAETAEPKAKRPEYRAQTAESKTWTQAEAESKARTRKQRSDGTPSKAESCGSRDSRGCARNSTGCEGARTERGVTRQQAARSKSGGYCGRRTSHIA